MVGLLVACTESTRGLDAGPTADAATDAEVLAEGAPDATSTAADAATATDADATVSVGFPVDVASVPSDELVFEASPSGRPRADEERLAAHRTEIVVTASTSRAPQATFRQISHRRSRNLHYAIRSGLSFKRKTSEAMPRVSARRACRVLRRAVSGCMG